MFINIFTGVFISVTIILAILITIQKMFMKKLKNTGFPALIAAFFLLFSILALAFIFILQNNIAKVIMLLFAISPFVIGRLATYKTEGIFSFMQISCLILCTIFTHFSWMMR